jgi:hypothetical protein
VSTGVGPCAERRDLLLHRPTLGVHALFAPSLAESVGTEMVRLIVHDEAVAQARAELEAGRTPEFVRNLEAFEDAGIEVVLTLRWPVNPGEQGADPDRIPTGADREEQLELVRWLVDASAGRIDYIQLNNEPLGGPGHYTPEEADAAIDWLEAVATEICSMRNADPDLANLRIVAPALTAVEGMADGTATPEVEAGVRLLIEFAEGYADLLDVHLHVTGVDSIERQLAWLRGETSIPLVTLEWSQAKAAAGWLDQQADPRFGTGTNRDVVRAAYEDPMTSAEWHAFTATAPHDDSFIPDAYAVFERNLVQLAAYGGGLQYGSPPYDLKMLFATKTMAPPGPNQPFHSQFTALAEALNG